MKNLIKAVAVSILTLSNIFVSYSQSRYEMKTVDPEGDKAAIEKMQAKMAEIRKQRPSVGLVLSGGGAKGAAHVGVIRYLEEMGIPVDLVVGTSMGGLVGGLYSVGYNSAQMEELLKSMDWTDMLTDRIPKEYYSYKQKQYDEKFLFSIPFEFSTNEVFSKREDSSINEFLKSLPSGYINGINVNSVFSSLTTGLQGDIDFCDLPTPFFCIASDMVSGKAKLWHNGKLNLALRSTMSIPGIFDPVRVDGMILIDGGIRNNYPTDVAKEMGADFIIGVELSDAEMTYSDINTIGDMAWKVFDILGMDSFYSNLSIPDITLKPDLTGYNMLSFSPENINDIIQRGYSVAKSKESEIKALKEMLGDDSDPSSKRQPLNIDKDPVIISQITFSGLDESEQKYLHEKLQIHDWDRVNKSDIDDAVYSIYASKSFSSVRYEILGNKEPYELHIICEKGHPHQIGVGARFDNEEIISLNLNLGLDVHKLEGVSFDLTTKISANPSMEGTLTYRTPNLPAINFTTKYSYTDMDVFDFGSAPSFSLKLSKLKSELYFSDLRWKNNKLKVGMVHEFSDIKSLLSSDAIPDSYNDRMLKNSFISAVVSGRYDSRNSSYFPLSGSNTGFSYSYVYKGLDYKINPFHIVELDASSVIPISDRIALIPSFNSRLIIGDNIPMTYINVAGGISEGKYIEQQIPFIGIDNISPFKDKMTLYRADLRWRMTTNNYLSAQGNIINDSDEFSEDLLLDSDPIWGAGLEYGYDSIVGPVRINMHYSNRTKSMGLYISFGYDF